MKQIIQLLALVALLGSGSEAFAENTGVVDPDIKKASGRYDLWEDVEGGRGCDINLTTNRTIGGYAIEGKEACFAELELPDDPFAWFLTEKGDVVLIDATRQRLVTLERHKDGEYYAVRRHDGLENLNLTRP